jgi:hypothetical protein
MLHKKITSMTGAVVVSLLASGCAQHELDCKNPRNQDEVQQCAHNTSTESHIGKTNNPKNWLELTDPKKR